MVRIYCHVKPISLSNIFTYWDTFSIYHTCPKIWKSPFCYLLMCLKFCCMYTSSSVDPDQMLHSAHSDLGLLPCRQRPICPSTYGYYSVWFIVLVIDQLDMALMNWFFIVIWFVLSLQSYEEDVTGSYGTSFPRGFGYGPDDPDGDIAAVGPADKPRILLMGLRRLDQSAESQYYHSFPKYLGP